jgi:hypothetical protein
MVLLDEGVNIQVRLLGCATKNARNGRPFRAIPAIEQGQDAPFDRASWTRYGEDEEPVRGGVAFGVTGIALVPFPVVLDDEPGTIPGEVAGGALRLVVAEGVAGGGLDEPELESLSHATSAKVASVAPIAMIVFFMIRLSEWFLHSSATCPFWQSAHF